MTATGLGIGSDYAGGVAERLTAVAARHGVAGASLAVLHRGEIVAEAATGHANRAAGVEATADTVFQIGSITKTWTATVAMQLVDEGKLDLDAPVREVLPELRLATGELTERLTPRALLTHTSGIDGDYFADTGRGDDNLEAYAALLREVSANHPLGATQSYCNAGFSLLGRVLEVVTGVQWDRLMRERLFQPLGLERTGTLPEEALRQRAAIGHLSRTGRAGGELAPAPVWGLMRSAGPAGLIHSTPREVLAFVRLHLDGGTTPDGSRLLSAESAAQMQRPQVAMPDPYVLGGHIGLAWFLDEWDGARVYGHDGNTIGQSAFLRVLPEHELAICLLTNGGAGDRLHRELFTALAAELAGVTMRPEPAPADRPLEYDPVEHAQYLGHYQRAGMHMEVRERDGRLLLDTRNVGHLAALSGEQPTEMELEAFEGSEREGEFVVRRPETGTYLPVVFYRLPDGSRYLHHAMRATPRVG
jgi:CubicO group peptidase (beta-lactamase class C family)